MTPIDHYQTEEFTRRILDYMRAKGYAIATGAAEVNIVYVEGCDADGRPNADRADEWNDLRIVIAHDGNGTPQMLLCEPATCEPGLAPTLSAAARRRGGVARIAFGQYTAWICGYHKRRADHPALVQVQPVPVLRDYNRDGLRDGDKQDLGLFGINHHGTGAQYRGVTVSNYSEGCSVGRDWVRHLFFMGLCKNDPRYKANRSFVFSAAYIPGDDLAVVCPIGPAV